MEKAREVFSPMRWQDDLLLMLDQTRLPTEEVWLECRTPEQVAAGIRRLSVRGAPAIGVSAAYGLVLGVQGAQSEEDLLLRFDATAKLLAGTRPTAVNLMWALGKGREELERLAGGAPAAVVAGLLAWAEKLHEDDIATNQRLGAHGAALFSSGDRVLTHCNTGSLATAGYGTALGVIQSSWDEGRVSMVWVDETRPLLQGARLTAWELGRLDIPFRLVTDSSAGALLARGLVDRVVVGADRIAANGDAANKIGTYPLAVLARRHGVPFYVAAPLSTVDPNTPKGDDIPIEERAAVEVTDVFGSRIAPVDTEAMNIAFDVTPNDLITAIITEAGALEAPYVETLARALAGE